MYSIMKVKATNHANTITLCFFLIHGVINILGITSYYKSKTICNVREILTDDGYLNINFVVIKQYFPEDDVMTTS